MRSASIARLRRLRRSAPRREPRDHPTQGVELRRFVLQERRRIAGASRIRELVLGFQDGLLVPLAVVTGLAGAKVAAATVIVGGLAEAAAGALAMGTGAYLASQAENQLFRNEIAEEVAELDEHPQIERLELELLFEHEGMSPEDARQVSEVISRYPGSQVKTMVEKELGLAYEDPETARGDALVVGGMYAAAAAIPLWPYFFFGVHSGLVVSLVVTALALFSLGIVKGRVVGAALVRSGLQVMLIGGGSAGIGYLVGVVIPGLL
ncbi:MAG: VIT1/CCC1 transporter family protein [Gaiellaceae bacterium]